MNTTLRCLRTYLSVVTLAVSILPAALYAQTVGEGGQGVTVKQIFSHQLPNVEGKSLTAVVVDYAPGGFSKPHRHGGAFIFAYVLSGAIRSQLEGGEAKVYRAGEIWSESPGAHHLVSQNASSTKPARLLAVSVADTGASVTIFDR
jgi:quercetin dioxygenase-like cupin family protein